MEPRVVGELGRQVRDSFTAERSVLMAFETEVTSDFEGSLDKIVRMLEAAFGSADEFQPSGSTVEFSEDDDRVREIMRRLDYLGSRRDETLNYYLSKTAWDFYQTHLRDN